MNKYIKIFLIILGGILLSFGAYHIFSTTDKFVTSTKIVEDIDHQNQNVYFTFQNDKNIYSFTEFNDVSSTYVLENINVGDVLIITTKDNVGEFKYTLIEKIEKDNNVIYDSIEYYKNHNKNLRLIFIPSILIVTLFLTISTFIQFGSKNTMDNFTIRSPKIVFNIFALSLLIGAINPTIMSIIYFSGNMTYSNYCFSYLFYIFLDLGVLGIVTFYRERLVYDGECYYIYTLFKKVKKVEKINVKSLVIDRANKRKNKSGIYDINDQRIYPFSFELIHCLKDENFKNSLINNNVRFVQLVLDDNGNIIESDFSLI